jgi:REP element-mobilizing transposase RayT
MPRTARLDIPGLLQHVIIRGIEKTDIFLDDKDRQSFLTRLSALLQETQTDCLAWALMPNHAHLLLRSNHTKLAPLMRRLLTGYAVRFNLRYQRSGHLFQNRYKSIVCEEEPYLLELVRYIHLNPMRGGLVKDMNELDHYRWCGHAVLMGNVKFPGQKSDEVLSRFGQSQKASRHLYRDFIMKGVAHGRRDELVGGGLRRSLKLTGQEEIEAHDERVLGTSDFVGRLREKNNLLEVLPVTIPLEELIERIATLWGIRGETLRHRIRTRKFSEARSVICYFAVREAGYNGEKVGKVLNMTRSGVCTAAKRGEEIVRSNPSYRKLFSNSTT